MTIGFITPEYPHLQFKGSFGGIATFTNNLAQELVKKGMKVIVFIHSQESNLIVEEDGVELHFIKKKSFKGLTWLVNRRNCNSYINKVIKQKNIDVIEAPEWTGFTSLMRFSCPLVIRLHGSDTYFCHLEGRKVKLKNYLYEKFALKGADKIVGVSQFVSDKTNKLFRLNCRIDVIYNSIDPQKFYPHHTNIHSKRLLYFGSIIRKKGVLELGLVFNELIKVDSEITLQLLGKDTIDIKTGESTVKVLWELLSDEAKKKIEVNSEVPYHKVIDCIRNADVVVLPSFAEAFPMTWLEAMSLEKKLVTSNIGWANELMINGKTGFMIDPKNIIFFTAKIIELLENDQLGKQMGVQARDRIKKSFNMKKSLWENMELYKNVIG